MHALITDPILDRLFAKHLIHFHRRAALTELSLLFSSFCTSTHTSLPETYAPRGIIRSLFDHEAKRYDSLVRILCNHLQESHAQNQIPNDVVSVLLKRALKSSTAFAHPDTIIYLLDDQRVDIHTDCETPLRNAVEGQNLPVVQLLLERGADPRVYSDHNLLKVAKAGNIPLTQLLLDHGVNTPNNAYNISSAVGEACVHGHADMAMLLLMQDPVPQSKLLDPSPPPYYSHALEKAVQSDMQNVVHVLLSRFQDCKKNSWTLRREEAVWYALKAAVEHGRVGMVKLLVESALDVYGLMALSKKLEEKGEIWLEEHVGYALSVLMGGLRSDDFEMNCGEFHGTAAGRGDGRRHP
ncbi:hypothetical protein HK104_010091 [Borealophlyctis nickersoniae]|nr:hypothetical protein HK104_010091 [Borealophlyctis nickersoniae]